MSNSKRDLAIEMLMREVEGNGGDVIHEAKRSIQALELSAKRMTKAVADRDFLDIAMAYSEIANLDAAGMSIRARLAKTQCGIAEIVRKETTP